ncbi:hypothetical protein V8F06_003698 [Rhypophila decipiens]
MADHQKEADYIVIGGGLTGCVVASRLSESNKSVILIEAGPDPDGNEAARGILSGLSLQGSDLDYAYQSEPEPNTAGRVHTLAAGKVLGGGSVLNYGGWLRADKNDYDDWGNLVGDERWSYRGILPWLRKLETFHVRYGEGVDEEEHGVDGPMHVFPISASESTTGGRNYPLREPVKKAWMELGIAPNIGKKGGSIRGITEMCENTDPNGMRQPSQSVYPLNMVQVLTNTSVAKVIFSGTTATGVELVDGTKITANKEVILAAGVYRTPQILMLSGIGPSSTLSEHGIPLVHDSPEVGKNLHDHFAVYFGFRLRDPSQGYAFGSQHPAWQNPASFKYLPWDWVVSEPLPTDLQKKHNTASQDTQELKARNLYEVINLYIPPGIPGIPMDGTHIATSTMLLRPTSRGEVSIRSRNPSDNPSIQPGYLQTESDKITLIHGARQTLRAFLSTDAMGTMIESESPPQIPGLEGTLLLPLKADSSDDEIEKRVKMTGSQHHHSGGTAAMGQVIDSCGRVIGVSRLVVVDASIVPIPLGGHPQATLYAMAEQLANFIIQP